jgi:hypothetical protein
MTLSAPFSNEKSIAVLCDFSRLASSSIATLPSCELGAGMEQGAIVDVLS